MKRGDERQGSELSQWGEVCPDTLREEGDNERQSWHGGWKRSKLSEDFL